MSTTKEVQSFNTILDNRDEIFQLMSGLRPKDPIKNDYLVVDQTDFIFEKVSLTIFEKELIDKDIDLFICEYDKTSFVSLCKLLSYSLEIELFFKPNEMEKTSEIWISWPQYTEGFIASLK